MGQGLGAVETVDPVQQLLHMAPHAVIVLEPDAAVGQAQMLIKADPLPQVKGVGDRQAGIVEPAEDAHAGRHILPGIWVGAAAVLVVAADLAAIFGIQVDDVFRDRQWLYGLIDQRLLLPVDQKLCSRSGNAADIRLFVDPE